MTNPVPLDAPTSDLLNRLADLLAARRTMLEVLDETEGPCFELVTAPAKAGGRARSVSAGNRTPLVLRPGEDRSAQPLIGELNALLGEYRAVLSTESTLPNLPLGAGAGSILGIRVILALPRPGQRKGKDYRQRWDYPDWLQLMREADLRRAAKALETSQLDF